MNKTAIKNFAIWARRKLISDITYKASMLGITENGIAEPLSWSTQDLQFFDIGTKDYAEVSGMAIAQRNGLVHAILAKEAGSDYKTAFRSVIEEVAYTWFNRLIAVRFMEVNDYLPSRIRVLSSESAGKLEPDLVTTPFDTDLVFTDKDRDYVYELKDGNKLDELFRFLFIKQCNALNEILPGLFEALLDYTELLLNITFTDKDGIVYHLTHDISEDEFNVEKEGQVEIIGWLYQYYNTEPKDEVFALLKKNVKITKERIPAATQLFTPDWIVRYMVENSLGRLWVEGHPNESMKANWKYYLEEAEQEPDVVVQLNRIREEYAKINPVDIKVIDPCMGSGHILVYAFDVLMQIYTSQGYVERDAAKSILVNNLYGIDIDARAYQLAYFAVMMKARQYNRKIFSEEIRPNLIAIRNPRDISVSVLKKLGRLEPVGLRLVEEFKDAEEYGSILQPNITVEELDRLELKLDELRAAALNGDLLDRAEVRDCLKLMKPLVKQGRLLVQKYDVVVTNPPYMGANGMDDSLNKFVKSRYPDEKNDLFAVFIHRGNNLTKEFGYNCMVTMQSWMFLSSFENMRIKLLHEKQIVALLHMENMVMHIAFGTAVAVIRNLHLQNYKGTYNQIKLQDIVDDGRERPKTFPVCENRNTRVSSASFLTIPGATIAYWASDTFRAPFEADVASKIICITRKGMVTADNPRFVRMWHEVDYNKVLFGCESRKIAVDSRKKWFPYQKGGDYRLWYGNHLFVVNWENDGYELLHMQNEGYKVGSTNHNLDYIFKSAICWNKITSSSFSARYSPDGFLYDDASPFFQSGDAKTNLFVLGMLLSKVGREYLSIINPTMNYQPGNIQSVPVLKCRVSEVSGIVDEAVQSSREDWDAFESSWDYKEHPFVWYSRGLWDVTCIMANLSGFYGSAPIVSCPLEICWLLWQGECNERFNKLKANEEELNRIFIDIYGLQDELTPDVADKDVTVRKAELGRDMRSFVSYAVGCMFGRYSLDKTGVVLAGQKFDSRYIHNPEGYQYGDRTVLNGDYLIDDDGSQIKCSFVPDMDNCIPITDEEYFTDDIVGRFVEFVRVVYGPDKLEENLDFVAAALGNKGNTSREVIRNYFLNDFYKDHLKIYQKRPIYWLFDSGKQNGFKALVYMHRWNADTVGNLRIEYLHKMQTVYEREIENCQDMIDHGSGRDVAAAVKRKEKLVKQLKECRDYDALVAHIAFSKVDIDLDDGVKVNYRKVQTGADGKFCEILAASKDIMAKEK